MVKFSLLSQAMKECTDYLSLDNYIITSYQEFHKRYQNQSVLVEELHLCKTYEVTNFQVLNPARKLTKVKG